MKKRKNILITAVTHLGAFIAGIALADTVKPMLSNVPFIGGMFDKDKPTNQNMEGEE